jgi:hypothetical protein
MTEYYWDSSPLPNCTFLRHQNSNQNGIGNKSYKKGFPAKTGQFNLLFLNAVLPYHAAGNHI